MPTTPTATTPTTTPDEQKSKVAAIQSGLPQLQERTGGSLAPDTLAHYAATGAGFPGQENFAQIALANWLGLTDTSGLFGTGGAGGAGGAAPGAPGSTPRAGGGAGPSLAMFPNEAVPAFEGLSGGSS